MTSLQVSVLFHCAQGHGVTHEWATTAGRNRQITWLIQRGLVREKSKYLIATRDGKKIPAYQTSK